MNKIKSTRLRFIRASSPEDLVRGVEALPFRVEIKGGPVKDGGVWLLFFVLPEQITIKMEDPGINIT